MKTTASILAATLVAAPAAALAEELPSREEMWRIIQEQQKKIELLEESQRETARKATEADEKAEAAVEAVEEGTAGASSKLSWAEKTRVGGYGELHYNNWNGKGGASDKDEADFHRFVLYFGHEFNDRIRFFSELEVEHATTTRDGSVSMEQAFLEFDLNERHSFVGGLVLVPVGMINEIHEPPTFYGTERNPIETYILPTTWREPAGGLRGQLASQALPGLSYDLLLHTGFEMPLTEDKAFLVRSGRTKGGNAPTDNGAFTGRLKWTGIPGVELAGSFQYQTDVTQGAQGISATLFTVHTDIERGPFGLRALYGRWDLENGAPGMGPASGPSPGRDEQYGFYIEPSYRMPVSFVPGEIGAFYRFNQWDNNAGDSSSATRRRQHQFGVNYWPHPDVVLKADVQLEDNASGADQNGFNLAIGYQFF